MNMDVISTPNAPAAAGPYSQGIRVGDIFFLSGQIPLDPATGKLVEGDICAQAEQCCKNVVALLGDEATVKRLSIQSGYVWRLPENEAYQPIDGTYAPILGRVSAVVRRY